MSENNSEYNKSRLKQLMKEDLKEFSFIYFIETFFLGIGVLLLIGFILVVMAGEEMMNLYNENPVLVGVLMFGPSFIIGRILVIRQVKKQCIKHMEGERQRDIERAAEWEREKSRIAFRQSQQAQFIPSDEDNALDEAMAAEYEANLKAQLLSNMEEEEAERAARASANAYTPNAPYASTAGSFYGVDGQWYTKDDYGYIRREGSTEIVGQNGYDKDGHRLESL